MEVGDGRVNEVVELTELLHVVPDCPVRRPEDMGAVEVDVYALNLFRVAVAADVPAAVENKHALGLGDGLVGDHRAEEAGANDEEVIVIFHLSNLSPLSVEQQP